VKRGQGGRREVGEGKDRAGAEEKQRREEGRRASTRRERRKSKVANSLRCLKVWPADKVLWRLGVLFKYDFEDSGKAKMYFSQASMLGHADSSYQLADILEKEVISGPPPLPSFSSPSPPSMVP
jgi:hypothetical protein